MSSTNGRYTINMYEDNSFHIKVNRYQNQLTNKNPNHISINPQGYNYISKVIPKSKKDEIVQNKIRKNKNKLYELSSNNNLSRLSNKQKLNKIRNNNSLRAFQKENSEKSIIDTLNNIRNSHRRFSNKVNGSNTNGNYSLQNINLNKYYNENSINDYRAKVINNKNKLSNPLIKATSFKNDFNNLKNMSKSSFNYYTSNVRKNNNNFLIDDTTSNDTDLLTESGVNNTKETNLYVYRSEVQYPVKNITSNANYLPVNNNHDSYNYLTLKTFNNDKYKKNVLLGETNSPNENNSKSLANSRTKRIIQNNEYESESYYLSPVPEPEFSKKRKTIKNYMTQNMINRHIDAVSVNKEKKFSERVINDNENDDDYHLFKKCYSRDKYGYRFDNFMERGNFDVIMSNRNKNIYPNHKVNKINNKIERNNKFLKSTDTYNFNNNHFLNTNRNKSKLDNKKLKIIPIFCDNVEKYLISVIKNNFKFFIKKMNKFIEIRSCKSNYNYYAPTNDNRNIDVNNLLLKRFNNKKLNKKAFGFEKNSIPFDTSRKKLDLSKSENKMFIFKINSRNNNFNNIYQKKSNSINKSLNLNTNNNNFIINNFEDDYDYDDDDYMVKKLKKRKNLSFNKVYVPKHKKAKKNMYKNLEINTFNDNEKDINNNNISHNNINYISKTNSNTNNNTNNNSFIQNNKVYQTISGSETIIKKINHITALKRKYINKKNYNNNSVNSSNSNILHNSSNKIIQELSNFNKKSDINKKNIYSKPLFNKIRNKILEKESERFNFNSAKKIAITNEDKNKVMNGLLYNSNKKININDNNNNNKNDFIEKNKKILKINKKNKESKENKENRENREKKNNVLKNYVLTKKKINYSSNNNTKNTKKNTNFKKDKNPKKDNLKNTETKKDDSNKKEKEKENIETKNDKDNDNNDNDVENYEIIRSIIVKDVRSRDKILNVFIKYYECNFPKSDNFNSHQLAVISTDSMSLISTNSNKTTKKENNKTNIYLHQILTSIIEEDEKSKANPSMNNSNSDNSVISEEESEKHNTNANNSNNNVFTNNIVIYLTNILQNLYDDNKKMILYTFMKNLKKIQNQLYLKSSLMQFNYTKNGIKDDLATNNNGTFNNNNTIENQKIVYNGKDEVEISSKDRNNSSKKIYFYTADNSFIELNKDHKNKNNILIGTLSFRDFEIKDEDEIIKPKKYLSSSSLNKVKINGSMLSYEMNEKKNKFDTKNKLKNIISLINKKIIINYFKSWKKIINGNYENNGIGYLNSHMDNGMNVNDRDNGRNYLDEKVVEINNDDLSGNGEVKFFDNGIDIEYEDMEIKDTEINKEVLKNYEMMEKINLFRIFLIKNTLNKKA